MPKKPDERIEPAKQMYLDGMKLIDIAKQLDLPEGTVRRWKSTHKWDSERSDKKDANVRKKRGGQPGNKNATGPPRNQHARKHGLFSKWLPEEINEIIGEIPENPLDILWHNIQLQYANIIHSQQILYVKDKDDKTEETTFSLSLIHIFMHHQTYGTISICCLVIAVVCTVHINTDQIVLVIV